MKFQILYLLLFTFVTSKAQNLDPQKKYFIACFAFWNVENLYDTLNDQWKNDEDFTPSGINAWTGTRYRTKIEHLAEVIQQMASDVTPDGPALMGLCEVENKSVLRDLVNSPQLKNRNYKIVHIEGPDARGVDPALIYNPLYFKFTKAIVYHVKLVSDSNHKTRDILIVRGKFLNEPLTVLVNHWPSRRGGEIKSKANRNAAAQLVRRICDSVTNQSPESKIIIMGDFNDDPVNESVKRILGTSGDLMSTTNSELYNPMEHLFKKGIGSLAWQDSWNLFDQILLNKAWLSFDFKSLSYFAARVFNKPFLKNDFGRFKGYPLRTYSGSTYTGGYSDHFPVYILIAKEKT